MILRIEKIQKKLQKNEAVIIFDNANRFYFTGFNSSAGVVIITSEKSYFLVDFRYFEKAKQTVHSAEVLLLEKLYSQINSLLKNHGINKVYFETESLSFNRYTSLCENLQGVEISKENTIQRLITKIRSIKDQNEIKKIKSAQKLTDDTFNYILERLAVGRTEREIALEMEFFMRKNGSDGIAFDFIVVSGKNSSLPHGIPTDKKFEKGDFVTMDFGAKWGGYCSDMTRTVALGTVSEKQRFVYDTVLKAQLKSLESIKSGAVCKDIDFVARNIINSNGFEGCFGHGLGHSLGVEIHENPAFNTRDDTVLENGMVMTVEPGIYLENKFGVRIEDMVLVKGDGIENLTHSPKELIII